jgi:anti-sigma B factor antagonist
MPHASVATHEHGSAAALRFSCAESGTEDASLVAIAGELDIATVPCLDQALRRAEADAALVVLDLRALAFIDSSGAHLLLAADRRIRRAGGRLVVVRGGDQVEWFFALIGIDAELEFVDWPSGARAAPAVRERVPA